MCARLTEQLELCDETGKTVGHFLPDELYKRLVYDWVKAQTTEEELRRISQEPGGRSLAEIWASLALPGPARRH